MGKMKVKAIAIAACLALCLATNLNFAGARSIADPSVVPHDDAGKNAASSQAPVLKLSPVQTWGDLNKLKRIDLGGGVNVRLGLSANHAPLYSGVLIYCLTEGHDYFTNANTSETALGPLSVYAHEISINMPCKLRVAFGNRL
jgi:hypothetical protein